MKSIFLRIAIRWLANSFGLWIAGRLIPSIDLGGDMTVLLVAGLVLSIVNTFLKPLVIILSLPFIIVSLGLFMIFINGLMVYVASFMVESFEIDSFGAAILAGIIIGLTNYVITTVLEEGK